MPLLSSARKKAKKGTVKNATTELPEKESKKGDSQKCH